MPEPQLKVETNPSPIMLQFLEEQINQHNIHITGFDDYLPLAIFVPDSQNNLIAALSGYTWGRCCEINFLWVHTSYRHQGYGRRLLQTAELEAVHRNCQLVVLDSYSFQAPDFYRQLGYTVCGMIEDCPRGHRRYYLHKRLDSHREGTDQEEFPN
ncbi:MAG: GNAT family N-acetyltransferase [Aliifodinibius sp.]|nr:GNAT family N-acetyltransferase [candidate division Zixibacteria bacterium]NIT58596.1 GNAT family N-acetyltransferase [Fodinibius sp.]NIW46335.1 GNAT family N-acetyltransferase [Gammaproteobacteria bacterium]NIR65274.1 GNAT family N-acetyltransferase [candidate division Zixibacteria bacterium]NIS47012.1 GNAT family N-acetyltransferase [candidate division Zixibacteria bacterium]